MTESSAALRRAIFPGSFDPLTVAHLGIAERVRDVHGLDVVHLSLSREPLGKSAGAQSPLEERVRSIAAHRAARPWLGVVVTDGRLLADVARGYDVLVVGADKWQQLHDVTFYDDEDHLERSLAALPRLLVVPRAGAPLPDLVEVVDVDPALAEVSSTAVRQGRVEWRADPPSAQPGA